MDARRLILEVDRIAREKGLTQAEWSRTSGFDEAGKVISRAMYRGDCKLSVFVRLLRTLGYIIDIKESEHEKQSERSQ